MGRFPGQAYCAQLYFVQYAEEALMEFLQHYVGECGYHNLTDIKYFDYGIFVRRNFEILITNGEFEYIEETNTIISIRMAEEYFDDLAKKYNEPIRITFRGLGKKCLTPNDCVLLFDPSGEKQYLECIFSEKIGEGNKKIISADMKQISNN